VFLMKNYSGEQHLNVGTGIETTIADLAQLIARAAGWDGRFEYDRTKPDGMPRKVMDVARVRALGWAARTSLEEGFRKAYDWYVRNAAARVPQT
jgi:GDP-L-fucose synthase